MKRIACLAMLVAALLSAGPLVGEAVACPMCQAANESSEDATPRAYMYSILFMLSMPAMLFTGFGIGFYRLWKKGQAFEEPERDPSAPDSAFETDRDDYCRVTS